MRINSKIIRAIETINIFIEESTKDKFEYGAYRNGVYLAFYTNNQLDEVFKEVIPASELGKVDTFLREFGSQSWYNDEILRNMRASLEKIKGFLCFKVRGIGTVFYSWQSDLRSNTNRTFIEDSLKLAISEINQNYQLQLRLDSDTRIWFPRYC